MTTPLLFALAACTAALLGLSVRRVPEGTVYTLRRFDGQARTVGAGTHLIWPLLERVAHRIALTGHVLAIEEPFRPALPGHEPVARILRGAVYWQVLDPGRADAVIEQAEELIRCHILDALQAIPAPEAESAEARNAHLKRGLNETLGGSGVLVTRVQLDLAGQPLASV